MKRILFVALLFVLFLPMQAEVRGKKTTPEQRGVAAINRATAEAHVGFLASDALMGRKMGTEHGYIAGEYLIAVLRQMEAMPLFDTGLAQDFEAYAVRHGGFAVKPEVVENIKQTPHYRKVKLRNILAKIEGKNPQEIVVVGAHYDHLGYDPTFADDKIFNGADDNASGVQAVLQILRAFQATGQQPERTVIFALWDGEESGLLGSTYFAEHFADMGKVKGYMNFDMIARNTDEQRPQHVKYMYLEQDSVFRQWLQEDINRYALRLDPDYVAAKDFNAGSDQVPFYKAGAKIVWYHTDGHPDYHMPSDHCERINWDKMVEITKAAYLCLWRMANNTSF